MIVPPTVSIVEGLATSIKKVASRTLSSSSLFHRMRIQYLHDTYAARVTSATSEGVCIFTATGRKKHTMAATVK